MTGDFFLLIAAACAGVLVASPVAYNLGKLVARREINDWRRAQFKLVKRAENRRSNVYEFPIGKNL